MSAQDNSIRPVLAATLGIALFAAMDAVMKGGALAIGAVKGALACHSGMATFAEAGVSDSDEAVEPEP